MLKNPEKSDRAIAAEIGVSDKTVGKARKRTADQSAVAKRTGRDGKKRKGLLLKEMEKAKGGKPYQSNGATGKGSGARSERPPETAKTLADLGVTKDQSSRWQQLAENPKAVERYLRRYVHGTEAAPSALETASRWCPFRNR